MKKTKWPGEKQAWDILTKLKPDDVEVMASVKFDNGSSSYFIECFGQDIRVSISDRDIYSNSDTGKLLIKKQSEYSRLSILWYLIKAQNIPLTGELIRPSDMAGGGIFLTGTHVLPLDKIAQRFGNNKEAFFKYGERLNATQLNYGDFSLEFFPLPRVKMVVIVWAGDEEFQANSSLLIDSSLISHMATDIVWSTAMMTLGMLLL